jgi:hypothetical protein
MIFLLFLASIGVLEAILHRDRIRERTRKLPVGAEAHRFASDSPTQMTENLLSLMRAVQMHERGPAPVGETQLPVSQTMPSGESRLGESGYNREGARSK